MTDYYHGIVTETWLPIKGWEGWYEVSDLGRVRSVARVTESIKSGRPFRMPKPSKLIKPITDGGRHPSVHLCKNGKYTKQQIDLLVCEAFHGERPEGLEAIHLNADKYDNRSCNLLWSDGVEHLPGEEWRDVIGYNGAYRVSSFGRLMTVSRKTRAGRRKGRLMTATPRTDGYIFTTIYDGYRQRRVSVHHMVCTAFHGERPSSRHQVRHLDGQPSNNAAHNLAWGTAKENAADRDRHGRTPRGHLHWKMRRKVERSS